MDDKGRIYSVNEELKTATNVETGKVRTLSERFKLKLTELTPEEAKELLEKNRHERRAWLAENKKK